ncbi:MAG: 2-hydroxyacyl-CoA dehydratase [Atopobiaceae bacterium]|nr:2-hydroxyacyl-CoA dehydratase [Atopobiaceae bacterium]MCI2174145.1 2-hydroxyacyl-CoA dehydratase [Atopobiaceae bacterium]MCI2206786.1 2-hydroxyacyl-CoA dehydratase [Atopobiaceae bacterium]
MADDTKPGIRILDRFGSIMDGIDETDPDTARFWLTMAFQIKRWQTRHLPDRGELPSGNIGARLALEGVTDALEDPDNAVITSIFLPNEIFHAMGLKPVMAEAISDFLTGARSEAGFVAAAEQRGVPETYCSFHKILIGAAETGVLVKPHLIANASVACDANNITFKWLAKSLGSEHVYVDVPYEQGDDSIRYVADQLRELAHVTEETFGRRLDLDVLKEYVTRSQATLDAMVRTLPLRHGRYLANDMGLEMQQALALFLMLGLPDAERMVHQMEEDYKSARRYDGLSLVWVHAAPYFSVPLQKVLDRTETAQIIASDMGFAQVSLDGWSYGPDHPFEAMAERLVRNSFNGPATRRIDRIRELAERTQADGVVVFCHWGCKETLGASQLMKRDLEAAGFPTLVLDGDGCNRANCPDGQVATRMGAFIEMLQAQRAEEAGA